MSHEDRLPTEQMVHNYTLGLTVKDHGDDTQTKTDVLVHTMRKHRMKLNKQVVRWP